MKIKKYFIIGIAIYSSITATADAVGPMSVKEADATLEHMAQDFSSVCGYEHHVDQEALANAEHVDATDDMLAFPWGYGFTNSYGCFNQQWPGGYCWVPRTLTWNVRLYQGNQDDAWFRNITNEFDSWQVRLNNAGWTMTRWVSGDPAANVEVRTGTTHPGGYLGDIQTSDYAVTGTSRGTYGKYGKCVATLYRTSIEANLAYQNASASAKRVYLRNLWDHEFSHCTGLAHTQNTEELLMSVTYYSNGVWFSNNLVAPTATEIGYLDAFNPSGTPLQK